MSLLPWQWVRIGYMRYLKGLGEVLVWSQSYRQHKGHQALRYLHSCGTGLELKKDFKHP